MEEKDNYEYLEILEVDTSNPTKMKGKYKRSTSEEQQTNFIKLNSSSEF